MSQITVEEFRNFFKYYKGEEHQIRAVDELYRNLDLASKDSDAEWIQLYREAPKEPEKSSEKFRWPITKQEMASIMGCSVGSLPDSLMDDFARCCSIYQLNRLNIGYFLGQCGHESAGLRYPVEIHDGSNYEGRSDLGNIYPGDGVKFAGTGWIQVTGRFNHQLFSDYMQGQGQFDHRIMEVGKTYTADEYPWSISGNWWMNNKMNEFCDARPQGTDYQIDEVGARVNGRMRPNGADERVKYTKRAFQVLGL